MRQFSLRVVLSFSLFAGIPAAAEVRVDLSNQRTQGPIEIFDSGSSVDGSQPEVGRQPAEYSNFDPAKQNTRAEVKIEKAKKDLEKLRTSTQDANVRNAVASRKLAETTKELDSLYRQIKTEQKREKKAVKQARVTEKKLAVALSQLAKSKVGKKQKSLAKLPPFRAKNKTASRNVAASSR